MRRGNARWLAIAMACTALVSCATESPPPLRPVVKTHAAAPPPGPAPSAEPDEPKPVPVSDVVECERSPKVSLRLLRKGHRGDLLARLQVTPENVKLYVPAPRVPDDIVKRLERGLRMRLAVSASLVDRNGRVLAVQQRSCQVQWLIWDELFEIDIETASGAAPRNKARTLTVGGVLRRCLALSPGVFEFRLTTDVYRVQVQYDVAPSIKRVPPGGLPPFGPSQQSASWESDDLYLCSPGAETADGGGGPLPIDAGTRDAGP